MSSLECLRWPARLGAAVVGACLICQATLGAAAPTGSDWLNRPLSLADCLNLALDQNAAVLKSKKDLEAAAGGVAQTRAVALPKVRLSGDYSITDEDAVDRFKFTLPPAFSGAGISGIDPGEQRWSANLRLVQSLYEGGRLQSAGRAARLTTQQAFWQHQAVLADTALEVRLGYYDVLLAGQQILVHQASVELLESEQKDTESRFAAGTVPSFNVLRAKVEVANARPRLIRARNALRIAKNNLADLLGYHVPKEIWEDIPLQLTGSLEVEKLELAMPEAIARALEKRPELVVLRKAAELRQEQVISAKAGSRPSLQAFAGYGVRKSNFTSDLAQEVHGWETGLLLSWDLFDGHLTQGKVRQARALREKTQIELDEVTRRIELEVRTAFSNLQEAGEVRESQRQTQEQAAEALRLARARAEAGTGTQLDVLSAQTALTEASTIQVQAQRDYAVARARLERAIGAYVPQPAVEPSTPPVLSPKAK